jgi:hypothetical protein
VFGEFFSALKARVGTAIQFAIWSAVAGVLVMVAAGFFVAALHSWLAHWYGPIQASLAIGGGFFLIALIIVGIAALMRQRAASRLKSQQQRIQQRLTMQPASLATTLMAQIIGPKQTTALMLIALAAGFMAGRPRQRRHD